jgi:hypothetical protein
VRPPPRSNRDFFGELMSRFFQSFSFKIQFCDRPDGTSAPHFISQILDTPLAGSIGLKYSFAALFCSVDGFEFIQCSPRLLESRITFNINVKCTTSKQ